MVPAFKSQSFLLERKRRNIILVLHWSESNLVRRNVIGSQIYDAKCYSGVRLYCIYINKYIYQLQGKLLAHRHLEMYKWIVNDIFIECHWDMFLFVVYMMLFNCRMQVSRLRARLFKRKLNKGRLCDDVWF